MNTKAWKIMRRSSGRELRRFGMAAQASACETADRHTRSQLLHPGSVLQRTLLVMIVGAVAMPAVAAQKLWNGGLVPGPYVWSNPNVWNPNGVPGANDDVIFSSGSATYFNCTLNQNASARSIQLDNVEDVVLFGDNTTLTFGNLTVAAGTTSREHIIATNVALSQAADWSIGGSHRVILFGAMSSSFDLTKLGNGTLTLIDNNAAYQGDITISRGELEVAQNYAISSTTTIDVESNGTLIVLDDEYVGGLTGVGNVILDGFIGVGENNVDALYGGVISGTGAVLKVGTGVQTLTGVNTYAGGTEVHSGTLLINNGSGSATGAGPVEVQSNATLGGTGSASGLVTVLSGGNIEPGNSAGVLTLGGTTFDSGATLAIELGGLTPGSGHDQLVVSNNATLGGSLDIAYTDGFTAQPGDSFVVLTAGTLNGTFNTVNFPDGQPWFINHDAGSDTVTVGICPDADGDGICDADDTCPGFDDHIDSDGDAIADGCDTCPGSPNVYNASQDMYYPTIQAALDEASNGDSIQLGACTFLEDDIDFPNAVNVTLNGAGMDQTFIDGGIDDADRVMNLQDTGQSNLTIISNLTVTNAGGGDAIFISGSARPTLRSVRFLNCEGNNALDLRSASRVDRCVFTGATGQFETVRTTANSLFVQCVFSNNDVSRVLRADDGIVSVVNCTFDASGTSVVTPFAGSSALVFNSVLGGGIDQVAGLIETTRCLYAGATGNNVDGMATFVDEANGDYRLAAGSPGIDAADNNIYISINGSSWDFNGDPRTHDDLGTANTGTGTLPYLDIGAFEFQGFTDSDGDGVGDEADGCPNDPNKTEPGSCGCGIEDTDSDSDGTADCIDGCPSDPNKTEPGVCGCGINDTDSDSDGTADCNDGCPADPNKIEAGICGCGVDDADSDSDGTADCNDGCPADPNKTEAGICGCGVDDADSDSDGTADCNDGCPSDPDKTEPGICGCGVADIDGDDDGVVACLDCNDTDGEVFPGQSETICDGIDNDCDPLTEDNPGDACSVQDVVLAGEGPRYLEIIPAEGAVAVALRITSDDAHCLMKYIDLDADPTLSALGIARLVDSPVYRLPADWGVLHARGIEIVPGYQYTIQPEVEGIGLLAEGVSFATYDHGDVDNNGFANFADIQLVVQGFQQTFQGPLGAVDLTPCVPNGIVNFEDIQQAVFAFQQQPYEAICPLPCDGSAATAAPAGGHEVLAVDLSLTANLNEAGDLMVEVWAENAEAVHTYQVAAEAVDAYGNVYAPLDAFIDEDHDAYLLAGRQIITATNLDRGEIGAASLTDVTIPAGQRYLATFVIDGVVANISPLVIRIQDSESNLVLDAAGNRLSIVGLERSVKIGSGTADRRPVGVGKGRTLSRGR